MSTAVETFVANPAREGMQELGKFREFLTVFEASTFFEPCGSYPTKKNEKGTKEMELYLLIFCIPS